jgi:hypothetical protein
MEFANEKYLWSVVMNIYSYGSFHDFLNDKFLYKSIYVIT